MSESEPVVKYEASGGIARIRFNRPRHLNALNAELAEHFAAALDAALGDPAVRVVVLAGEGRAFMAGGDLAMFRGASDKPRTARTVIETVHAALKRLAKAPQLVIASLHGPVAGAGMSVALNADFAIAADDVTFNLAYVKIGASPDCGASWALPRLVGLRRALEIALLSETIGAEEALRLGLVNRVVPAAELEPETAKLAARLAAGPPMAQAGIKRLMHGSFDHAFPEQLDLEAESFAACAGTRDLSEAVAAFFSKRER